MLRRVTHLALSTLIASYLSVATAAEARVELELATSGTFPATAQQQWYKVLTDLGVDGLRIRKAESSDKVEVKVAGSKAAPVYRVIGRLSSGNQLDLPGGSFSPNDRAGLSKWLAKLRTEGPASSGGASKTPFGLSPKQFAAVNADLAARVTFSSKEMTPGEFLDKLSPTLNYSLNVERATREQLAHAEPISEELEGLTSGTAIAYALRSEGFGLLPRILDAKKPEYTIIKPGARVMTWPVGWPLEDRKPKDVIPELYEQRNAEIDDFPLGEALEAIAGRLKTPVLYDHYALARQGIDVTKVNVKFPAARTWYGKVIDKLLHQAGLKGEWRLDDAGKPLLWVTTLKPVR
jgi:hypothetical protein